MFVVLQVVGVNLNDVKIVNLCLFEVVVVWVCGDIDVIYIWDLVFVKVKQLGMVLMMFGQVVKESGKVIFDGFVVSCKFVCENFEFVMCFVKVFVVVDVDYCVYVVVWKVGLLQVVVVVKVFGVNVQDVLVSFVFYVFLMVVEQVLLMWFGGGV